MQQLSTMQVRLISSNSREEEVVSLEEFLTNNAEEFEFPVVLGLCDTLLAGQAHVMPLGNGDYVEVHFDAKWTKDFEDDQHDFNAMQEVR